MQTDLRIILLGCGLVLLVGIIWDGFKRRSQRNKRHAESFDETIMVNADTHESLNEADPLFSDHEMAYQVETAQVSTATESTSTSSVSVQVEERTQVRISESDLITFYLIPKGRKIFNGQRLLNAMKECGLNYSSDGVFNGYHDDTQETLFQVANISEPGTFSLDDMTKNQQNGLVFFMVKSKVANPLKAFDNMLSTARKISHMVNGEVCDRKRTKLTSNFIENQRNALSILNNKKMKQSRAE